MKSILYILFFNLALTTVAFSQVRQQKLYFRNGGTYYNTPRTPSYSPPPRPNYEVNQKLEERERNRNYYNQQYNYRPHNYGPYFDGWYGLYPRYGWYGYNQYWWYDRWGYRNPYRVYIYQDGTTDTLRANPVHGSVGVSINNMPELGVWFTVGREYYFIGEVNFSYQSNNSTYYPDLTYDKVISWGDRRLPDYQKSFLVGLGVGKKVFKDLGVHAELGFGATEVRNVFYDNTHILSNNGNYSIFDNRQNVTTVKIGAIGTLNRHISVKLDYDVVRQKVGAGLGFNF